VEVAGLTKISMKNLNTKADIMKVFEANPKNTFTPSEVAQEMKIMGLFTPYTLDVHIRQLYAKDLIEKPLRGVYRLKITELNGRPKTNFYPRLK